MMKKLFLLILISNVIYALEINESFRLDGYANITAQETNNSNIDSLENSAGIQGRYQLNDNISFTGHLYFEESKNSNSLKDYEEDIKWLFMDYYLEDETTLRAGKFQFPIFTSAEIGTIGYSRTWTENPISSYGAFGYDDFIGAEAIKNFYYEEYDFSLQLSYGKSENDLPSINDNNTITGKADSIKGVTLKTSNDWLMLNIGYMRALSSIESSSQVDSNTNVNFDMYAIETQADLDDFSFKAGFIKANLSSTFPDEQRYYTSIEYTYDDFTPYIYYANEKLDFKTDLNNQANLRESNQVEKYSAGIRYDLNKNIAFKLSYTKQIETTKYHNNIDESNGEVLKGAINVLF